MGFIKYFLSGEDCVIINDGRRDCIFLIQCGFIIDIKDGKEYNVFQS